METHSSSLTLSPTSPQSIIESRLSTVETRLSTIETRLSHIDARLTRLTLTDLAPLAPPVPQLPPRVHNPIPIPPGFHKFKFYDACNNILILRNDPSKRPTFKITTTNRLRDPGLVTAVKFLPGTSSASASVGGTLMEEDASEKQSLEGEIHWSDKRIKVGDASKSLAEVKRKIGGPRSLETEWTWHSGTYIVTVNKKLQTWTVSRKGQDLAIYTALKVNQLSENEMANVGFMVDDMLDEEGIFLILILMFDEFQRPQIPAPQDSSKVYGKAAVTVGGVGVNVASNVAANAAGAATANAVASCCVVQ